MPLRPPKEVFTDLRHLSRWCREQEILADDDSITTVMIQDEAVTLAKLADVAADTILGNNTTAGPPEALTFAVVVDELQAEVWEFSTTVDFDGAVEFTGAVTFTGASTVGFFGATAVSQQASPATVSLATISGTGDDTNLNSNFVTIQAALNSFKTALDNLGLTT